MYKILFSDSKLKEECGVFGISNNFDASTLTALGLHALQHRGQEGCGIVSYDGKKYHSEKRFGLVGDNFNKEKVLKNLPGKRKQEFKNRVAHSIEKNKSNLSQENPSQHFV